MHATCPAGCYTRGSMCPASQVSSALWYPKWVPGTHAPSGPIKDVAGLRLETSEGKAVPWRRDDVDLYKVSAMYPMAFIRLSRGSTSFVTLRPSRPPAT